MDNELYHHGVLGMKWGVRRYQNADGSLTYAGKKRALKMQDDYTSFSKNKKYRDKDGNLTYSGRKKALRMKEQYSELTGGKQLKKYPSVNKTTNAKPKKISVKDLSDDELRERTARLQAEKDYIDLARQMADLKPKEVSKGKAFVDTVAKDVLLPAATDVGKQVAKSLLTDAANKALNLDGELKVYANNKKK